MNVIYQPKGRAGEYAELALNVYTGCGMWCRYCYVPLILKRDKKQYHERSMPREGLIKRLNKDLAQMKERNDKRRVLMCFACDPYQPIEQEYGITRMSLNLFGEYGINFSILTKAASLPMRDLDLYKPGDAFGCTLTFSPSDFGNANSAILEPYASLPQSRYNALKLAHERGIETWASLEPVLDVNETLQIIRDTHTFVDHYKIGNINYNERKKQIDWHKFKMDVESLLNELGKSYYLKKDLQILAKGW